MNQTEHLQRSLKEKSIPDLDRYNKSMMFGSFWELFCNLGSAAPTIPPSVSVSDFLVSKKLLTSPREESLLPDESHSESCLLGQTTKRGTIPHMLPSADP